MSQLLRISICCSVYILSLTYSQTGAAQTDPRDLTAAQILDRVYGVYATCKSYSDSGEAALTWSNQGSEGTYSIKFQTAFVRPRLFRYQYTAGDVLYIVWMDGNDVQKWWTASGKAEKQDTLGSALAAAAGVSGMTSVIVPSLLQPDSVRMRGLFTFGNVVRIDDDKIGDVNCFRLSGTRHSWTTTTVWIDADTFLVRRMEMDGLEGRADRRATVTFNGAVNRDVDEAKLKFNHP